MLLSVIVPTCERNDLLAKCLDSLAPEVQNFSAEQFEVIVTDDGHSMPAQEMVRKRYPWAKWVQGPCRGAAANRNHGARQAQGDWIAFVDDDCIVDEKWLTVIVGMIQQSPLLEVIEGKTITPDKTDSPFLQGVENLKGGCFWSCNLALRREKFLTLNGFDEDFLETGGEDLEFAYRIHVQKLRTAFNEDAIVFHPARKITWRYLWWMTLRIRWLLLYRLKTNQPPSLETPFYYYLPYLFFERTLDLLRTTWQFFSRFDPKAWKTRLFYQCWNWLTFPIVLPYIMLWEIKFRSMLKHRQST